MGRPNKLTDEQRRAVYEAYAGPACKTIQELAEQYSVSRSVIDKAVHSYSYFVPTLRKEPVSHD